MQISYKKFKPFNPTFLQNGTYNVSHINEISQQKKTLKKILL